MNDCEKEKEGLGLRSIRKTKTVSQERGEHSLHSTKCVTSRVVKQAVGKCLEIGILLRKAKHIADNIES